MSSPAIVLTTLNATYIHASLGLRYLLANMGELKPRTVIREFTIARKPEDVFDALLLTLQCEQPNGGPEPPIPQIIGFGVYIWNVLQTTAVVRLLKARRPDIKIILGGPEVSHETNEQEITSLADHVITGWGDLSFAKLCRALIHGPQTESQRLSKIISGEQPDLNQILLPYTDYTDADLAHRVLYVEASRGCPFSCEFCLSALDKTAWAFDLDLFLQEMETLYRRGARQFKFVDRTFNLKIDSSVRILKFFLNKLAGAESVAGLFVHFEVIPDHLPERLKSMIAQFPPGALQFEVGIQSFTVDVQQRISRKQNNDKAAANLHWLVGHSNAHLHTDLIFGLPGETLESFAAGFDRLYALGPHEIQLGILKRLRGTPIVRHTAEFGMVYDPAPPYAVQATSTVDAATMQRIMRLTRYWDMLANSGRFQATLSLLLNPQKTDEATSPFATFLALSDWLWQRTEKTSGLTPEHLVDALFEYLCTQCALTTSAAQQVLSADYLASGARGNPQSLHGLLPKRAPTARQRQSRSERQQQHLAAGG